MNVIERAEQRLKEEERQNRLGADNDDTLRYWAAYLDGARAQMKENEFEQTYEPADASASPWHRVEEPPEPHKKVLVSGMEAINNSRVYKVMVNDNGEWRPKDYAPSILWDYWMPIEPPKEEA